LELCGEQTHVCNYPGRSHTTHMFVYGVAQLSIVVQDKPATLPSLKKLNTFLSKMTKWVTKINIHDGTGLI